MSKSTLKLKHFEIFNLTNYLQSLNDDILQEEEDIIDIISETSNDSKFIFNFLLILSKGTLIYLEYNTTLKKVTNHFRNSILNSIITNEILSCELSFQSPILISTTLNEIILIDTKQKPCQIINLTEENINITSQFCETPILEIKFNSNQSLILVTTTNQNLIYKIGIDKYENKQILQFCYEIKLVGLNLDSNENSTIEMNFLSKFSYFSENILYISYISEECLNSEQVTKISLDNDDNTTGYFYLNIVQIILNKKDYQMRLIKSFNLENTLIKVCFSYFYEKIFLLYKGGLICLVNHIDSEDIYDPKFVFKYPLTSDVKFCDIFFHPSSNFVIVKDTQNDYLIFDFTLNLYYIMHNSKITVKLNMQQYDENEITRQVIMKPYEINFYLKNYLISMGNNKNKNNSFLNDINDFKIDNDLKKIIYSGKLNNNSMFFYDSRIVQGIFIEISSTFNQIQNLNPILDEFQLLKNHLRGLNFDSSFKILMMIENFSLWLQSLLLIVNKLCSHPNNILMLKKHSLSHVLDYLKLKKFEDDTKTQTVNNIKIICFTNLLMRCLSVKQYEYAFLIAEKLGQNFLFKIIISHSRMNKHLGISYLACNKIENDMENEENIIFDLNKIINSSNFVLSQGNLQTLVKDIDQLLENNNLNSDYIKENNSLEINLQKYMEALRFEMEGKFDEAKEIYKQNNLNYDYMRVEKLNNEILSQMNEDCVIEFNDL